ncbi:MAG: hypothetical protein CSA35_06135 [Dethiosulfovibrio peptidovorans]|nr:MAG: hypothetical protein CSA35_06135 [Dethiosulfovibrio peptidovorans]
MHQKLVCTAIILWITTASAGTATEAPHPQMYKDGADLVFPIEAQDTIRQELPPTFDPESIRLETSGTRRILSSSVERAPHHGWLPSELTPLFRQAEDLKTRIASDQAKIDTLTSAIAMLDDPSLFKPKMAPSALSDYLSSFVKERSKLASQRLSKQREVDEFKKELVTIQHILKDRLPKQRNWVSVVTATTSGSGALAIRCRTPHARWHPSYRLDLDTDSNILTAKLQGTIVQKTGIPFQGPIDLHTSVSSTATTFPAEPSPLAVDIRSDRKTRATEQGTMKMLADSMPTTVSRTLNKKNSALPVVEETLSDRIFTVDSSVRGDGIPVTVTLETWSADVTTSIETVPYLSPQAVLMARCKHAPLPALGASVQLYAHGHFVGNGGLPKLVRGQSFAVSFGAVPSIQVERKDMLTENDETWTGKGLLRQGYSITITNGTATEKKVTVKDRIPVSVNGAISIHTKTLAPQPSSTDDKTGILTWELPVNPRESKTITVLYEIRYPSDKRILFFD